MSSKIASNAVTGAKVAANSLTGADINESTLSGIGASVMTGSMEFVVGSGATVMCLISGTATSCTAPGPVSLPASTSFSVQTDPHGSPAAADLSFGYVLTTP